MVVSVMADILRAHGGLQLHFRICLVDRNQDKRRCQNKEDLNEQAKLEIVRLEHQWKDQGTQCQMGKLFRLLYFLYAAYNMPC